MITREDLEHYVWMQAELEKSARMFFEKHIKYDEDVSFVGVDFKDKVRIVYSFINYLDEWDTSEELIPVEEFLKAINTDEELKEAAGEKKIQEEDNE